MCVREGGGGERIGWGSGLVGINLDVMSST